MAQLCTWYMASIKRTVLANKRVIRCRSQGVGGIGHETMHTGPNGFRIASQLSDLIVALTSVEASVQALGDLSQVEVLDPPDKHARSTRDLAEPLH